MTIASAARQSITPRACGKAATPRKARRKYFAGIAGMAAAKGAQALARRGTKV